MADRKIVDALLAAVEKDLGMETGALAFGEDGQSFMQIDEDGPIVAIDYVEDQNRLVISSVLAPLEDERRAAAQEAMLKANFLWQDTFGATFSLDPGTGQPVLMHAVRPAELEAQNLIELVEGMADLSNHWQEEIANADEGAGGVPRADGVERSHSAPGGEGIIRG